MLRRAAKAQEATFAIEGEDFAVTDQKLAVGGQLLSLRGLAGAYDEQYLPLYGRHQGENAALAVAAFESLIGDATRPIADNVLSEGLQEVVSPGRLQLIGIDPTVIVDAAHNPHGAGSLAAALREAFDFEEWGVVLGVLDDKDAAGIIAQLGPVAAHLFVTEPDSPRADSADFLADLVEATGRRATVHRDLADAAEAAREWASAGEKRAVVIAGSVVLAGEALALAEAEGWKDVAGS